MITETWGVFHSPEEFVAKAVATGHPHGMRQCLPEVLKGAIKTNKELSVAQRARKRTLKIKQWMEWATELAQQEEELKASMHVDVKTILSQKKIKLWERLLCDGNYADLGVVQEFVQGTSLVGEVEQCGLWPAKFSPALITESELLEISERDKTAVLERIASSSNPITDDAVWEKTMAELGRGWLKGPLLAAEVPNHCPLSRRFGVVQGQKVRCVDDYTRSSVNLAVQVTESPKPHTVDVLASLMVETMTECVGGEPWAARTFDLKDAYRQCAVCPSSSKFAHIAVKNPKDGGSSIFRMLALPFGSIKSVHSFLRVAHSLWFILVAHLDILVTNYFDDFVVVCRESEASHLTSVINAVFKLLGWDFAEEGPKAPAFASSALALGVRLDVSSMHLGKVWIDNTESRKNDLSSCIREVLRTGDLNTAEALRLRGRMQFTSGQLFGRLSRSTLNKVTHHAYRSCKSKTSSDLQLSLSLYDKFLVSGQPRLVSAGMTDTWFIFTDASYEIEEGVPTAGFGGVLVDPAGTCLAHFGFVLRGDDLNRLNPNVKQTIIHECEFLAVAITMELWKDRIATRQVVSFIDNNAVRDSLISGKASGPVTNRILESVLENETRHCLIMWFARVPSKSNIADDPSRGCFDLLDRLGSMKVEINIQQWLNLIVPKGSGGS